MRPWVPRTIRLQCCSSATREDLRGRRSPPPGGSPRELRQSAGTRCASLALQALVEVGRGAGPTSPARRSRPAARPRAGGPAVPGSREPVCRRTAGHDSDGFEKSVGCRIVLMGSMGNPPNVWVDDSLPRLAAGWPASRPGGLAGSQAGAWARWRTNHCSASRATSSSAPGSAEQVGSRRDDLELPGAVKLRIGPLDSTPGPRPHRRRRRSGAWEQVTRGERLSPGQVGPPSPRDDRADPVRLPGPPPTSAAPGTGTGAEVAEPHPPRLALLPPASRQAACSRLGQQPDVEDAACDRWPRRLPSRSTSRVPSCDCCRAPGRRTGCAG